MLRGFPALDEHSNYCIPSLFSSYISILACRLNLTNSFAKEIANGNSYNGRTNKNVKISKKKKEGNDTFSLRRDTTAVRS